MTAFDDAQELVKHARAKLPKIRAAYDDSLHAKRIAGDLLVEIKNFLENLRSALDFSARGLFDRYGTSTKSKPNIYFPYAAASETRAIFVNDQRVEKKIPGLTASRPDIVNILAELQHFGSKTQAWLPTFMALNNENKHERLTPQTRREMKELRMTSQGAGISLSGGASISIGGGASISIGSALLPGGQVITAGSQPNILGNAQVEHITWVSFTFDANGESVIPFLTTALSGVEAILTQLKSL